MLEKSGNTGRLKLSGYFLSCSAAFYLFDCFTAFREHPDLPWFETGIYAGGPAGFFLTAGFAVFGLGVLLFARYR